MKINEITANSKKRAEEIAKREGGLLVPVYAVVKTDEQDRVRSITHDRLLDVTVVCQPVSYQLDRINKELERQALSGNCAVYKLDHEDGDFLTSTIQKQQDQIQSVDVNGVSKSDIDRLESINKELERQALSGNCAVYKLDHEDADYLTSTLEKQRKQIERMEREG